MFLFNKSVARANFSALAQSWGGKKPELVGFVVVFMDMKFLRPLLDSQTGEWRALISSGTIQTTVETGSTGLSASVSSVHDGPVNVVLQR